jgi:hypothetical protein
MEQSDAAAASKMLLKTMHDIRKTGSTNTI